MTNRSVRQTPSTWLIVLLTWAGFGLRVLRLRNKSTWFDEGYTAWLARADIRTILLDLSAHDTSPPLHYIVLHGWRQLVGESAFALRYLSVIAGFLTIALVYQIGKSVARNASLAQPHAMLGLFSALILAVNRFHISWSQEIRNYALGSFVATLAVWGALRTWRRGKWPDMLIYVFAMAAALFSNYLGAFVLLSINIAWLWEWAKRPDRWREFWRWSLMQVAVLALFLPWLAYAIGRMQTWDADSRVDLATFAKVTWATLNIGIPANFEQFYPYTVPLFVLFALGLALIIWQGRQNWRVGRNLTLTLVGLLIPGTLIFLLTLPGRDFLYTPPVAPRYFMFFVAIYCVGLAWGLLSLTTLVQAQSQPVATVALAGFILWIASAGLQPYYRTRDVQDRYQSLTATIHAHERPNDTVVLFPDNDWPTFDFYYGPGWRGVSNSWLLDEALTNGFIEPIWADSDGLWLVSAPHAPITDPNGLLDRWLSERAVTTKRYDFGEHQLTFYAKTEVRAATLDRSITPNVTIPYKSAATNPFKGHDLFVDQARSGDNVFLGLHFETPDDVPLVGATVEMVNVESGERLISMPLAPTNGGVVRQAIKLAVPAEAVTGEYQLRVWFDGGGGVVDFGRIHITQRNSVFLTEADIDPTHVLNETFSNGIILLGYDLDPRQTFSADSQIPLTLYWQSAGGIETRYKVFTHLLGDVYNAEQNNFLWGQQDNEPNNGKRPTTSWRDSEIIIDRYAMPILPNAPTGRYRIEIGLYNPITGNRLPLTDTHNHLILDTIEIDIEQNR
ncbi:MAG: glycosyltransferase family 39 protein [Candidatus Promineifilaceae bacterium]